MITVFIINDHPLIGAALGALVDGQPGLAVLGVAGCGHEALAQLDHRRPDVILLGPLLGPDPVDGSDLCRKIQHDHPGIACVTLGSGGESDYIVAQGLEGAVVELPQLADPATLSDALHQAGGGTGRSATFVADANGFNTDDYHHHGLDQLTAKELTIFDLIGEGLTNRQIAERVGLAEKSVKNRASALFRKLGLSRRAEVAALAGRLHERASRHR